MAILYKLQPSNQQAAMTLNLRRMTGERCSAGAILQPPLEDASEPAFLPGILTSGAKGPRQAFFHQIE